MITTVDTLELNYLEWLVECLKEDMKNVQLCREYYEGEQMVFLTDRMKEFLQLHNCSVTFRMNICKIVIDALMDELVLQGFGTDENDDENRPVEQWAKAVYRSSRLDEIQNTVHKAALLDSETFIIVDWDEEKKMPKLVQNDLYVSTDVDGDGYGCWMVYDESDQNVPIAAVKEWVETVTQQNGQPRTRRRKTVYYPDRIERFYYDSGWKQYTEDGKPFQQAFTNSAGEPIGIPVIHFRNTDEQSEIWEVIPQQDAINKIALDVLGTADMAGFPTMTVFGFEPTESDGTALELSPMKLWGTTRSPSEAAVQVNPASDITPLVNTLMSWIALTANLSGTPVSRFIMSGQIAGSETLKEQDKPLQKKAQRRRVSFGNSWERAMNVARRMANTYGAAALDEAVTITSNWRTEYTPEQLRDFQSFGVPQEFIWQKAGLSQSEIDAIKSTDEYIITFKAKVWKAVADANGEPVPAETILKDFGYQPNQLTDFATDRMNAIKASQADVLPVDDGNNPIHQ